MLLIWGFRRYVQQLLMTMLVCNNCHNPAAHALRKFTTKFTFFFIPLFPVSGRVNEHVRCDTCQGMFPMAVLARPTSAQLSGQLLDGVRGLIVHVLRAGSMMVPEARATAVHEVQGAGLPGYTDQSLAADLDVVPGDLSGLMGTLGGQLADQGKENLLRAVARTALADGPLTDLERSVLSSTGAELGMTPAHTQGLIAMVEQQARSR